MDLKIGVILASVRDGRHGETVAQWVLDEAKKRNDANVSYKLIDIKSYGLPFLGVKPTEAEAKSIAQFKADMTELDGYILVSPEYNRTIPAGVLNAFEYLLDEVKTKAISYVGYGFLGAARGILTLLAHLQYQELAVCSHTVHILFQYEFENLFKPDMKFNPGQWQLPILNKQVDQLLLWSKAMKLARIGEIK